MDLNYLENKLETLKILEKDCLEKKTNVLFEYLIHLTDYYDIPLTEMQINTLKNEINILNNNQKDYLIILEALKNAIETETIDLILKYSNIYKPKKRKLTIIESNFLTIKALCKRDKKNEPIYKTTFALSFIIFVAYTTKQTNFPYELLNIISKIPLNAFKEYQKLTSYVTNCKISKFYQKLISDIDVSPLEDQEIDTSFIKLITSHQKKINKQILIEQQIIKEKKQLKRRIKEKEEKYQGHFFKYQNLDFHFKKYPELIEDYLLHIVTHNDNYLNELENQIKEEEQKWPCPYTNLFLDYNYNIKILTREQQEYIKEKLSLNELQKLLEILSQKEFSFLKVSNPYFVSILLKTNTKTLTNLLDKIQKCLIPKEFIINNPIIFYTENYQNFLQNQKTIKQANMNINFFWNSNLLLLPNSIFSKYITLIQNYHYEKLELSENYFDNLDQKIENRFEEEIPFPSYLDEETEKILENQNPIELETNDKYIEQLDQNYKIDHLRYVIAGIIISRLKVIRYYTYLNTIRDNKKENLQNAILYHAQIFEFEKDEILNELHQKRRLLIDQ